VSMIVRSERSVMAESIEQLRIYKSARALEDKIYELVKRLPADQFYGLGNDLRRSSAGVSHYIMSAHRLYSYRLKLDELTAMRREAEIAQNKLEIAREFGVTDEMISEYTIIIKQSWNLSKWIRIKLQEKQQATEAAAKDREIQAAAT
jgi:four helix bundle protein